MEQQRKDSEMTAEIDDARCRRYGDPRSQAYGQCRASLKKERSIKP